jgi:hypothetical protein
LALGLRAEQRAEETTEVVEPWGLDFGDPRRFAR